MTTFLFSILFALSLPLIVIFVYLLIDSVVSAKKINPGDENSFFWLRLKNRSKEKQIMKNLIKDLKENRQDWLAMDNNIVLGEKGYILNQKTGVGFYAETTAANNDIPTLTIIKPLLVNGEFTKTQGETSPRVYLEIKGSHVTSFMRKALSLMKTRQTEIEIFDKLISERKDE